MGIFGCLFCFTDMGCFMTQSKQPPVLIVGYGKLAKHILPILQGQGRQIYALTRRTELAEELSDSGITPLLADLAVPASLDVLNTAHQEIYFLAPTTRDDVTDRHMRNFLNAIQGQGPKKILYISTTAVYGNQHGDTVNEQSPTEPSNDRGKRRLDAEQALQKFAIENNLPVVILRVGGIYGPDRLPLRQLQSARPVLINEDSGYTNRIHVDDLANICVTAMERGEGIYNVSDGQPGTMAEYFITLAEALGYPIPERISLAEARKIMSPEMMSYLEESRRMDVSRLLEELGIELMYPDLASGIEQIKKTT